MFSFAKNLLAIYFIMNECIIQRQAAVSGLSYMFTSECDEFYYFPGFISFLIL